MCGLFGGVLAGFANAYWALDPTRVLQARLALLCAVALAARAAVTPRAKAAFDLSAIGRRPAWLLTRTLGLALSLGVAAVLVWMHAAGYITALILAAQPTLIALGGEVLGLLVCVGVFWRRPGARPQVVSVAATLLFLGSALFVPLNIWMWTPPDTGTCEAVSGPEPVTRLTPPEWAQQPSHPFRLLYVPEEGWLVASFKMGGNGHLSWWDDPTANRMMAVDVDAPEQRGVLPLTSEKLPCYMTYHPARREVLVSRMGPGEHSIDVLGLESFPELSLKQTVDLSYAPHEVVVHPASKAYGVVGQHGHFVTLADQSFDLIGSWAMDRPGDHAAMPLFAWQAPQSAKVYVSFLMYPLAEIDMVTGAIRWSEILKLGGGQLVGNPESNELFVTDMVFDRVDVLDMTTLTMTRRLEVPFTPRAVQVDAARDLLMVGEWFAGVVHLYRLSTLEPLNRTISVGPYLRDMAHDPTRGMLFTASQCGVHQVEVSASLSQGAP